MLFLSHVFEINLAHQLGSWTESVPPWNTKDHPRCERAEGVPEVSWKPSPQGAGFTQAQEVGPWPAHVTHLGARLAHERRGAGPTPLHLLECRGEQGMPVLSCTGY